MTTHKYIFVILQSRTRTYKCEDNQYKPKLFKGEESCTAQNISGFRDWFKKLASITQDDQTDFCYISDQPISDELFNYTTVEKTSWSVKQIKQFCTENLNDKTYILKMDESQQIVHQVGDVEDKSKIKQYYLKCVPELRIEQYMDTVPDKHNMNTVLDEHRENTDISYLDKYYLEKLNDCIAKDVQQAQGKG